MSQANRPQINIATDFDGQPGFDPMGVGLPSDFLQGEPTHVCATIAMMALQAHAERVQRQPQALVTLALYAAGVAVTLTTRQFRGIERRVLRYMDVVGDVQYHGTQNWNFAHYVHERAVERAKREKLI
jgi:hypothetical protein